ncbi:dipeptidase AC [Breoghania corrubedonensis]|uniref:Dipeptidase AC n=1 Tax=Breoghania corrubedonensis TaxID=665038 RepID=A0A2T5VB47_9HYPH|nr:dipeptidase [Breoghania corrubedonensis]PTW60975.1 dipeptidase AC [Breoghania corrubedonensis]
MTTPRIAVFDGHNDTLLRMELDAGTEKERSFFEPGVNGHIDLPRAQAGGFAGGFFAMFVPSHIASGQAYRPNDPANFAALEQPVAKQMTDRLMARARSMEEERPDAVAICRSSSQIRDAMAAGRIAMLLHIEGAEAIDTDFTALEEFHGRGLRSLGIVWSRANVFGAGAPMRCPSSPDTGPGLTDAGVELVRACNRLGILVDLSHLTEKGFWDVARVTTRPLVATHSNAHAICPSARNLTDRQLDAIAETGGVVGLNFHVAFLRPDGAFNSDTPLETMVRHVDHLVARLGPEGVAIGSDFDGCMVSRAIGDAAGLQKLFDALRKAGYDEPLLRRIGSENWLSVLERSGI